MIPQLLAAGKHVLAEKPLGRSAAEAHAFATAADAAERVHGVGFSWRRLAAVEAVARLIATGAIGEVWHASAWYLADYASTAATPLSWRYDREQAGGGAIVDVGAHVLSVLEHITGPIRRVVAADARTLIPERPIPAGAVVGHGQVELSGETGPVTTDDVTTMILELDGGGSAQVTVSRIATGVPNSIGFHVIGSEDPSASTPCTPTSSSSTSGRSRGRRPTARGRSRSARSRRRSATRSHARAWCRVGLARPSSPKPRNRSGRGVETDFWSGYRTMLVCDAAQQAATEGRPVAIETAVA